MEKKWEFISRKQTNLNLNAVLYYKMKKIKLKNGADIRITTARIRHPRLMPKYTRMGGESGGEERKRTLVSTGLLYTPGREMKVIWKRVKQPAVYQDMSAEMLRKRGMEIFRR